MINLHNGEGLFLTIVLPGPLTYLAHDKQVKACLKNEFILSYQRFSDFLLSQTSYFALLETVLSSNSSPQNEEEGERVKLQYLQPNWKETIFRIVLYCFYHIISLTTFVTSIKIWLKRQRL